MCFLLQKQVCKELSRIRKEGVQWRKENDVKYMGDVIDLIDTPPKCTKCEKLLFHHVYESKIPTGKNGFLRKSLFSYWGLKF